MRLGSLLVYLFKRIWIVIIAIAICAGPVVFWAQSQPDMYKADATVYIVRQTTSTSTNLYQELLAALSLIKDYKVLIPSTAVTQTVQEKLSTQYTWAKDVTASQLAAEIGIKNDNDSHLMTISVTDEDPEKAAIIANSVVEVFKEFSKRITVDDSVIEIEAAKTPSHPTSLNNFYIAGAAFLGLVLGVLIALLPVMLGISSHQRRRRSSV